MIVAIATGVFKKKKQKKQEFSKKKKCDDPRLTMCSTI